MRAERGGGEDVREGFASGADDYLPKPFELAILISRLESLLRRSVWMKDADPASAGSSDNDATTRPAWEGESEAGHDTFWFGCKSIDFQELGVRTVGNTIHLTMLES